MEGATSVFRKIYRMVVVIFATAIFSTIFIMCMISTCYITSEEYEITFFCKSNIFINVAFLFCQYLHTGCDESEGDFFDFTGKAK